MADLKLYLDAMDPRLWWLGVTLLIYCLVHLWRALGKYLPQALRFEVVPTRFRALPAAALALVIGATGLSSGDILQNLLGLVLSGVAGVTSVGLHEMVQRLIGAGGSMAPKPPGG